MSGDTRDWEEYAHELEVGMERLKAAQLAERQCNKGLAFIISITDERIVVTDPVGDDVRAAYLMGLAVGIHGDLITGSPFKSP